MPDTKVRSSNLPDLGTLTDEAHPDGDVLKASQLAEGHVVSRHSHQAPSLLGRLKAQETLLRSAYHTFAKASSEELALSYAAEWLLDNFYMVQQALRLVREDMPAGYYHQLAQLDTGPLKGYPRIYSVAREIIRDSEAQLGPNRLRRFVHAYQQITPLTMGECWALPVMLRVGILECLTAAVARITGLQTNDGQALLIAMPREMPDDTLVANSILSLKALAAEDWKAFFEDVSRVEQALRAEPANVYAHMDFETRDRYRKVVERLALATGRDEEDVAREAVQLAQDQLARERAEAAPCEASPWDTPPDSRAWEPGLLGTYPHPSDDPFDTGSGGWVPRRTHVGFYLLDAGRAQLEASLGYRPSGGVRLRRWLFDHPTPIYLGSIALMALTLLFGLVRYSLAAGGTVAQAIGAGLLALIPAISVAIHLVNWIITHVVPPQVLPKMDFDEGVPVECSSMVVIPALLAGSGDVKPLIQQLELHFLRNSDPHVYFALLTDFADAPEQHMPEDEALIEQAASAIQTLNERYGRQTSGPFYLFHRQRTWNPSEEHWMGWERKRGKLEEFNRLLRGNTETSYNVQRGDLRVLPQIRYVITLDADTVLPSGSACRLIAALSHPLNHAEFDPHTGAVVAGYTVLQPRTEIKPTSANQSLFTRVFAGDTGLDLYTRAVSDVYQDFFGEGIYVGKGIYAVDAFERSLAGRVPDNALLSHDLFEGIHGRAGLVTDVVLLEDYPPHYLVHAQRLHRWVRGDWQLLPWLLPRVPHAGSGTIPNDLSPIDRWKILDNLRRSLLAPALLILFVAGWLWLPGSAWVWTLAGLLVPAVSLVTSLVVGLFKAFRDGSLSEAMRSVRDDAFRWLLALTFLPYETVLVLDAILTTLARLLITRRRLLQWTTAAHAVRLFGKEVKQGVTRRQMISSLLLPLSLALLIRLMNPAALPVAVPLLIVWLVSPEIAYWISRPMLDKRVPLSADQRQSLRALARRTWLYFERFVGPDDNWLSPDHFQESPRGLAAHRTSPTNVGLLLLSTLAAYDLGYIGPLGLALRLRSTFDSMDKLERYRGHFLNWYDTRTLEPLPPRYVSTVDSGNLAACLLALRQGCLSLLHTPVVRWQRWQGMLDTLAVLAEVIEDLEDAGLEAEVAPLRDHLTHVQQQVLAVQDDVGHWASLLASADWEELDRLLVALVESDAPSQERTLVLDAESLRNLRMWSERVRHHLDAAQRELDLLVPWLPLLSQPPTVLERPLALAERGLGFAHSPLDPSLGKAWQALVDALPAIVGLDEVVEVCKAGRVKLAQLEERLAEVVGRAGEVEAARAWCASLGEALDSARLAARALLIGYEDLSRQAEAYFQAMEFGFLFDSHREVFHLGYNAAGGKLDNNYYDLLASEARIASLVAIAKGEAPKSHWLHLGRPLTQIDGARALLSWSGTMFEYLMPALLMRSYEGTLLNQSSHAAVDYQIAHGRQNDVPWGISESGYYGFDASLNYQYRAFGVPGLGFKRGLAEDLVIAPYASLLALPVRPQAVVENIAQLIQLGMLGRFGLYEAVDYTRARLSSGQKWAIVRSYMTHHQGMIMLSLTNSLHDQPMLRRFHADPRVRSVELLLQEQVPQQAPIEYPHLEEVTAMRPAQPQITIVPWGVPADAPLPQAHFLSNGRYGVLITSSGGGYSQWEDMHLTRWRADTTLDDWGNWIYLQDRESGALWSTGYQPTAARPQSQETLFYAHKAEFRRRDHDIFVEMEITVAPEEDVEIRRIVLTNYSDRPRRLSLTSYGEVVLAPQATDQRHPAFNKLFIESEYLPGLNALLFRRRPRSADEDPVYLAHVLVVEPDTKVRSRREVTGAHECDRARFIGRGRTPRAPAALSPDGEPSKPSKEGREGRWLSGATGATLDPIMALGQAIELEPHAAAQIALITLATRSRQAAIALAERYQSWSVIKRAFDQARSQSELELRQLDLSVPELERFQQLLSVLLYPHAALRAEPATLAANIKGQPGLWPYSISGDYPVLLALVNSQEETAVVRELIQAHTYWRNRRLKIDLVILNQHETGYAQEVQGRLHRLVAQTDSEAWLNRRGGIFLLQADQMSEADQVLLKTAARAIVEGGGGSLAEQLARLRDQPARLPAFVPSLPSLEDSALTPPLPRPTGLLFDNGLGGFSPDGREYVIYLEPGQTTPAPWINVIANPDFGFLVSEAGGGYTWAVNSGENRLTPWRNDPVSDSPGEALYLRDEETAQIWSPTPLPAGGPTPYLIRHGAGYSIFEHHSYSLKQRLRLFAAPDAPVKVVQLRLENTSDRIRRITATFYAEWVLGITRDMTQPFIVPEYHAGGRALLARNAHNVEFGQRVAFVAASKEPHGLTADRAEFLGRMGSLNHPAALDRIGLASTVAAALDPCAAMQVHIDLPPGEVEEIFFLLGEGADRQETLQLIEHYQDAAQVEAAWQAVTQVWDNVLGAVTVHTPDPAMNLLLNRWLLYQALACRLWGRSALYQSSGAYGFRDQLQDVLALVHAAPDLARQHILEAASHQFEAGDVLHWWHPPSGRGVRTRFSDDLVWLPFVTAHYVTATCDKSILNEKVPFLRGEPLRPDEEERYGHYETSAEVYTVYEHCRRALNKGMTSGPHGLPLMGSGDWNDSMNRVGIEGQGESVWLGWFLYDTLTRFIPLCEQAGTHSSHSSHFSVSVSVGNEAHAKTFQQWAGDLRQALEANAWDGQWYLRAYYDDGTPLGSARNRECQIDSLAQSWGVLSGAADPARAAQAMEAVAERLARHDDALILLFTPPFDKTPRDPGYIKGYAPGIRENGGQYTHAALWAVWAFAKLGQGDRAEDLFRLLNPIYHADTPEKAAGYKVEPYVIAGDVYGMPPHTGRGGWTWYTGSSGWMYQLGLEAILGLRRVGQGLRIDPCIPRSWSSYELTYRYAETVYQIHVENPEGVNRGVKQMTLDGEVLSDGEIPLLSDGQRHQVRVQLG